MATDFTLTLDTTAPAGVAVSLAAGATYATSRDISAGITTSDGDTTGYQMKVWGDVDAAYDASVQPLEANSTWISYAAAKAIRLSNGDGVKTVYVKIRDDVYNESAQASDAITLDTSAPVPNINVAPSASKVSKVTGKDQITFGWQADAAFVEYKVKVVPASGSTEAAGTTLLTTNGSANVSGNAGNYNASTTITTTIDGADLEAASAGDGAKVIKVFVKDAAGNWSV